MEDLADFYKKGLLEVRVSDNYAFVCCPAMDEYITIGQQRQVYKDLKYVEFELCMDGICQVVAYTKINNPHMMIMFAKLGYKPFHLSLKREVMWFKKEL